MSETSQTKTIARSAGTVSIAVFASRILGLVREQVFAIMFGAGYAYDAFVVAYRIPNLLRDLFAEGALSSAFVAVFTDYKTKKGHEQTWQLANNVISSAIVVVGSITLLGACTSGYIVSVIAPDFFRVPGKQELTVLMTAIMFPFLLLVCLSAVSMGILNTMGQFFVPSIASSFFNLGSILSGVALSLCAPRFGLHPIVGMAIGVLIGGVLQLGVQVPSLRRQGLRYNFYLGFRDEGLLRILKLMVPAIIGLSATQINIVINTFFAQSCAEGSVSWLNFAFRILMFPIGLVGVSLSIAMMPVVSRHASQGDLTMLKKAYVSSTVLSLVFSIPATFGLIFLAEPIVRVIFEHGNFGASDTLQTSQALALYTIGLFAYASLKIIVPVFYSLDKTRYPVMGSFLSILLNICIVVPTLRLFQHKAIALATSLCITANFFFLSYILYREIKGYDVRHILACLIKIVPIALLMGLGVAWINDGCKAVLGEKPFANLLALLAAIGCGMAFYAAAVSMLGIKEVIPLRDKVVSKIFGKRV
jgi:putative peptidoglycan lipid II flippase